MLSNKRVRGFYRVNNTTEFVSSTGLHGPPNVNVFTSTKIRSILGTSLTAQNIGFSSLLLIRQQLKAQGSGQPENNISFILLRGSGYDMLNCSRSTKCCC